MFDLVTRYIGALAAAPEGETIHFIYQTKEGNLIEKSFLHNWSLPNFIGPAKLDTSAAYYIGDSTQIVVSLGEANILQNYEYDKDEDEWFPGNLSDLKLEGHPKTKLAITETGEQLHLYFQNCAGVIQEALYDSDGIWKRSGDLSEASPIEGTCINAVTTAGAIHVFYVHGDNTIHQCVHERGNWSDISIRTTENKSPPTRILVSVEDGEPRILYVNEAGDLVIIEPGGSLQKVGVIGPDGVANALGGQEFFTINFHFHIFRRKN